MDSVKKEVKGQEYRTVREPFIDMEQESVQAILQHGPYEVSKEKTEGCFHKRLAGYVGEAFQVGIGE